MLGYPISPSWDGDKKAGRPLAHIPMAENVVDPAPSSGGFGEKLCWK